MSLLVRTWNLYHGRTYPKTGRTYLERMVRLVSLDAPDIVALQEVPLWSLGRLERWSGMQAVWAVTVPNFLGPVARFVTDLDPVRVRFTSPGQANAVLLNPHFEVGKHGAFVMNPRGVPLGGDQGRPSAPRLPGPRGGDRRRARSSSATCTPRTTPSARRLEVGLAAEFVRGAERVVLCGDFNVPRFHGPDFSPPIDGIDQILVRGSEAGARPGPWPKARRRVTARLCPTMRLSKQ